ncbi:hypothetical protein KUH32_15970 [Thalassococcus sp. CAU 1522]|uniref:Uncharacterized protein n=1 Tax=Thalassococcus arenae TaxID=2851652 RepID=A0ABS6NC60_9RHOB|nr:hypothetical protein [Thalassococcus arenae]MBV2361262.1 hypothetical protein [Thalassococcus arenae]
MKTITLIQAAALLMLAVFGAVAATESPPACPSLVAAAHCSLPLDQAAPVPSSL